MIDYSQNGEQEHILKFFAGRKGRFLDIGAFDGVTGSNTRALSELGWEGVCVEASPIVFERLLANRHPLIHCVNAAVMPESGLVEFHDANGQCGTCLKHSAVEYLVQRHYHVAAICPAELTLTFGCKFDFVSLDIEGVDLGVLQRMAGVLSETDLLCFEDSIPAKPYDPVYYQTMLDAVHKHGFSRIIARTGPQPGGGNTLIARDQNSPCPGE